ncbi:unnamed protein product [Heligmosomoides polygyrus]|uniref:Syntaxin-6_N domain-containing protein n=1 Tax=Heligmosomoides polygyrus TaxID=6339 RepID=A0A183G3K2_HELPZ|nr:unnamed protein product [Heligmosomoides polygyrus]
MANLAHPGFDECRLDSPIGTNMPCECMDVLQRTQQQDSLTPSSADFVDQLRSQASELQTVVTDIQNMINRASNGCPSQERSEPLVSQSKEVEWERFAAGVKELKVTMARLLGNVKAEDERRAIRERFHMQNNPFCDNKFTLFRMSLSGPRDTPLFD